MPRVSAAVRSASATPAAPVAALATPELITTACGSASSRWRRETATGAACTRFVVQTAPPTARGTERTSATSGDERRIPAVTPLASNPRAAVTDIRPAPPRAAGPRSRRSRRGGSRSGPPGRRRPCRGCRARRRRRPAREAVLEDADLRAVRLLDAPELGDDALGQDGDDVALRVVLLEKAAQVRSRRAHVARRDEPSADGQEVRDERDREAEERRRSRARAGGRRRGTARSSRARRPRASSP